MFVDREVVRVETHVGAGAVGIAFEDDVNIRWNTEESAKLNPTHQLISNQSLVWFERSES